MSENVKWTGWRIVRKLGSGSFGTVYEIAKDDNPSFRAALKVITIPYDESELKNAYSEMADESNVTAYFEAIVKDVEQEIVVMKQFQGLTNIVSYDDHMIIRHPDRIGWDILIRMELLTPLNDYIRNKVEKEGCSGLSEEDVIKLGKDICNALVICEKSNVIHRDIKPENIFVNKFGDFVLGDFGIARQLEKSKGSMSIKGTFNYMAPEVYNGQQYGKTVDLYSLGLVMYRYLNNNRGPFLPEYPTPIKPDDRNNALDKRIKGDTPSVPLNGSPKLKEVILKAISFKPEDRFDSASSMLKALQSADLDATVRENDLKPEKTAKKEENKDTEDKTVGVKGDNEIDTAYESERTVCGDDPDETKTEQLSDPPTHKKKSNILKVIIPVAAAGAAAGIIVPVILNFTPKQAVDEVSEEIWEKDYDEIFLMPSSLNETEPKDGRFGMPGMTLDSHDLSFLADSKYEGIKELRLTSAKTNDGQGLTYISGIENLSDSLQTLFLDKNGDVKNIKPLETLGSLSYLMLNFDYSVGDYSPLAGLGSLKSLSIAECRRPDNDERAFSDKVSFLSSNDNLEAINLRKNNLTDISFIKDFDSVQVLNLSENNIKDLDPISDMEQLKYLLLNYTEPQDYEFLKNDQLTRLSLQNVASIRSINELTGSGKLSNLKELDLNGCKNLESITGVENLEGLEKIYLGDTKVNDVSLLNKCDGLKELSISNTGINDISFLSGLNDISHLWLSGLNLNDIDILSSFKNLEELDISGNAIKDLNVLSGSKGLKKLDVTDSEHLRNITSLEDKELERFRISDSPVDSISALSNSKGLKHLTLARCPNISDYSMISDFKDLTELYLVQMDISDISFLQDLGNIETLELTDLGIKSSDVSIVSKLSGLKKLILKGVDDLKDLDCLKNNKLIHQVNINKSPSLTDISALGDKCLERFSITESPISSISALGESKDLSYLYIGNCPNLKDFSVLNNLANIKELHIVNMDLPDMSFLKNIPYLETLDLSGTNAEDLSAFYELHYLKKLNLKKTKVNKDEVAKLSEALPDCEIMIDQ